MTRERWLVVILAAVYAAVGTLEYESDRAAEKSGAYAPEVAREDPDLFIW